MITYPVYQATFGGSSDCMCHVRVRVAAKDKRDARRKLLAIQNTRSNTIGKMVRWSDVHKTNVLDDTAIILVRELRTTAPDWRDYQYG
jgi:hypothetical protein